MSYVVAIAIDMDGLRPTLHLSPSASADGNYSLFIELGVIHIQPLGLREGLLSLKKVDS
jgi:hypothetical protein